MCCHCGFPAGRVGRCVWGTAHFGMDLEYVCGTGAPGAGTAAALHACRNPTLGSLQHCLLAGGAGSQQPWLLAAAGHAAAAAGLGGSSWACCSLCLLRRAAGAPLVGLRLPPEPSVGCPLASLGGDGEHGLRAPLSVLHCAGLSGSALLGLLLAAGLAAPPRFLCSPAASSTSPSRSASTARLGSRVRGPASSASQR